MLEKNIQDLLNAGIGLIKLGEENFKSAVNAAAKTFDELSDKGASDNSVAAVKIREVLENSLKSLKDVSDSAGNNFQTIFTEAQKNYSTVLEQIQAVVGEDRISDLNSRFNELTEYIKNTADQKPTNGSGPNTTGPKS